MSEPSARAAPCRRGSPVLLPYAALLAALVVLGCGSPSGSGGAVAMHDVESSALKSVGYDGSREVLVIKFTSGSVYEYDDVPRSVYEELMNAPSKGRFFNANIKGLYTCRRIH